MSASEDDIIYWQDVLDAVMAGRSENLPACPFCQEGGLTLVRTGQVTRIECHRCRHYIEGRFAEDQ